MRTGLCCVFALMCVVGAVLSASLPEVPHSRLRVQRRAAVRRSPSSCPSCPPAAPASTTNHFLTLIAEIARIGSTGAQQLTEGFGGKNILLPAPIKIDGKDGSSTTLQLVVLPVPVPAQCSLNGQQNAAQVQIQNTEHVVQSVLPQQNSVYLPVPEEPSRVHLPFPVPSHAPPPPPAPHTTAAPQTPEPAYEQPEPFRPKPRVVGLDERRARNAPYYPPVEDSQVLLQQFRAQVAQTPSLPPIAIGPPIGVGTDEVADEPEPTGVVGDIAPAAGASDPECRRGCMVRVRLPGKAEPDPAVTHDAAPAPPLPRFDRSLMLKAVLTVPRADYSEPYTLWWDAASGASRIDYHDGSASTYRMMRLDGRMHTVQVVVDRTGETDVRRCTVLAPRRVSLKERALPVLPDLSGFTFAGYLEVPPSANTAQARVERWRYSSSGGAGAARGEVLTYRHELLVARAPDNHTCTPLRYAVAVDSSVLGDNADAYAHRFYKVRTRAHDPAMFHLDIEDACEQIENTNQIRQVEPLREFAMLQRDPAYDSVFQKYKKIFNRRYADDLEEAVRLNFLMQSSRFVSSGNREGASSEHELNYMADRSMAERSEMFGVSDMNVATGDPFPYTKEALDARRGRLPQNFDWRELGGVTHVRNQSLCSSCWAFSVVGAVEGALFAKTGRLVPLSEQSLVDCGHPYGTHGCKSTWPTFAYYYVQDKGLPALNEYTPYVGKEQTCVAHSVPSVTRIGGHVNVTADKKDLILALKVAIRDHGPTVVLIDAHPLSFATYKTGYYSDAKCKKNDSNHAVLAVGWTTHRGQTYFIVKNSWTTAWGEDGYMKLGANRNTCGLLRRMSYPVLEQKHVLHVPADAPAAHRPPTARL